MEGGCFYVAGVAQKKAWGTLILEIDRPASLLRSLVYVLSISGHPSCLPSDGSIISYASSLYVDSQVYALLAL